VASANLTWPPGALMRLLGERDEKADREPDADEQREHPQEEGGLAHREPRGFRPRQEEPGAPNDAAVRAVLGDLAGHGGRSVLCRPAIPVEQDDTMLTTSSPHPVMVPRARLNETRRARWVAAVAAAAALGTVAGIAAGPTVPARGAAQTAIELQRGDIARVAGVPIGCRVARRGVPPATMLDCRRAGALAGTYGVLLGRSRVRVVRFRAAHEAQVVFTATHGGGAECCTGSSGR
jgi:hypothetical protein